jgi:tRNA(fMet)-specific endonuclease VapC
MSASADRDFAVSVITVEEQLRGRLALIARYTDVHRQVTPYRDLLRLLDDSARWKVLPFDDRAADEFERLRKAGIRIGSMDLKIASVALANGAMLLTANLRDFRAVPGLRAESWAD